MRINVLAVATTGFLYLLNVVSAFTIPKRDFDNRDYFIVELDTSVSNKPLTEFIDLHRHQYQFEHQMRGFDDHFVFSSAKQGLGKRDLELNDNTDVKSVHILTPKKLQKRLPVLVQDREFNPVDSSQKPIKDAIDKFDIQDPNFPDQWHLINSVYPGNDVNVTGLWAEGITGKGIVTALVDDGLDAHGEDLKANFNEEGSWDFNDNTKLPLPRLFNDYHGTRCAGEIAAVRNGVCGVGVSYDSQVSGLRILSGTITAEDEAAAMIYGKDINDIYSCSWGPTDDGKTLSEPELIVKKAMVKGVQEGRNEKGSIYVFASGNGGRQADSCNFDGYTNSIYSITVGAIDYKGMHPNYAEACSAVMVVTYSSGSGEHIHTTDFHDKCADLHGGTSAAAPLAAGIFSLVLQSNPNLTWRDLQYVAALSSVPVNEEDGDYQVTALNRKYSHKYGYGKIDSYQMAHFAKTWENVKPQAWYYSDVIEVNDIIKFSVKKGGDKKKVIKSSIMIDDSQLKSMNLERIEHVTVVINIRSSIRGQVGVRLISPTGVISDLATFRPKDRSSSGFDNWTFLSVAHWGENGLGEWKLEVFNDPGSNGNGIKLENWQLRFFGESIDGDKADKYDIEKDYAAVRRDRMGGGDDEPVASSSVVEEIPSSSTTIESTSITDDINKGVESPIVSLSQSDVAPSSTNESDTSSDSDSDSENDNDNDNENDNNNEDGKQQQYANDHKGFYFMAFAIIGFVIIMILMKYHKTPGSSRRRRRREEYEFDIIPGEDYSDSEADSHDSLDLGNRNDDNLDDERDRLFDEFNGEALPNYKNDDMFKISEDDDNTNTNTKTNTNTNTNTTAKESSKDNNDKTTDNSG